MVILAKVLQMVVRLGLQIMIVCLRSQLDNHCLSFLLQTADSTEDFRNYVSMLTLELFHLTCGALLEGGPLLQQLQGVVGPSHHLHLSQPALSHSLKFPLLCS